MVSRKSDNLIVPMKWGNANGGKEFSYGFRPNRNCHTAIKRLNNIIENGKISYVVDADIKGFFNNVNHEWMIKFLELRIGDILI
jgi:RNA-directed DNA polymerase